MASQTLSGPFICLTLHLKPTRFCTLIVALLVGVSVHAQGNGISVGQPKVYDNQSLMIMLDQLNERLSQVTVIDQQSLAKALGYTQGSQQQDVVTNFNASVSLTPKALTDTSSDNSNLPSSPSDSTKSGSSNSSGKTSSTGGSNTSALPELLTAPAYKPDYGENSIDLLSDQVDLTYQIFNLRMLLERSVTDRLLSGAPRRQAVVSFNITVDPPENARDAAAYVEITLSSKKGPISLVASMPQEKTYNATSLSSSSNAYGGSAVAKIISISYNQRKRNQIFYLYRDSDTLALERSPVGNSVTFGWVFRPVLGRRSVSPGMRQMFAVIALPDQDLVGDEVKEKPSYPTVEVQARTYWLHYDRNSSTTAVHGYRGFWNWSAKRPPIAEEHGLDNIQTLPTDAIENGLGPTIRHVQLFQTTNGNTVLQISGTNFFSGTTVTIGDRTFAGPQDGLYLKSSETMLLTTSSGTLSKALSAVVNGRYGPAVPLYPKASTRGIVIAESKLSPVGPNFTKVEVTLGDPDEHQDFAPSMIEDFPNLVLTLNGTPIPYPPEIAETTDAIAPYPRRRRYVIATTKVPNSLLHSRDNRVGIVFPLLGQNWSAESLIYDADEVQITRMTTGQSATLLISRPGIEFNKPWQLILDGSYSLTDPVAPALVADDETKKKRSSTPPSPPVQFSRLLPCQRKIKTPDDPNNLILDKTDPNRCYTLKIVADSKFLANYQKLILVSDTGYLQILDMPTAASEKPAASAPPTVTLVNPPTVELNEVVTVTITGTGLSAVKQVSFEGKPLSFWTAPTKTQSPGSTNTPASSAGAASTPASPSAETTSKTEQIEVLLSRDVTGKTGRQALLLQVDAKNMAPATITVTPVATGTPKTTTPNSASPSPETPKSATPNEKTPNTTAPSSDVSGSTTPKPKTE
jgi:hypothetical protein